jgi:hypothetical protein
MDNTTPALDEHNEALVDIANLSHDEDSLADHKEALLE